MNTPISQEDLESAEDIDFEEEKEYAKGTGPNSRWYVC